MIMIELFNFMSYTIDYKSDIYIKNYTESLFMALYVHMDYINEIPKYVMYFNAGYDCEFKNCKYIIYCYKSKINMYRIQGMNAYNTQYNSYFNKIKNIVWHSYNNIIYVIYFGNYCRVCFDLYGNIVNFIQFTYIDINFDEYKKILYYLQNIINKHQTE